MTILNKSILSNSAWMMLEKVVSIFGLIFVTSYVAKYIGPTNFGKIALATTIFTFVQTLVWFGNQEILFKRVSRNPKSGLKYLFFTQKIRQLLFFIITIPLLVWFYFFTDFLTFIFGLATALATFFLVLDIFVIYNNATLKSYINALSNIFALGIALLVRYLIVFLGIETYFLAIPIVLVTLLPYLFKKYGFNRELKSSGRLSVNKYNKYYLMAGGALVISSLSISLYTQITSLILAGLTSTYELGIYSVAITLGMSWSFVNNAIITSVLSKIYKEKNDAETYFMVAKLNGVVLFVSIFVIVGIAFLGKYFIVSLYGIEYIKAYSLLLIVAFATLCSGLGTVAARLIIKDEGYTYISKKMLAVAIFSIPIAYVSIYFFGLIGAAYSIALIEFLSCTVFNYFYKNGLIFKIHFYPLFAKQLGRNKGMLK